MRLVTKQRILKHALNIGSLSFTKRKKRRKKPFKFMGSSSCWKGKLTHTSNFGKLEIIRINKEQIIFGKLEISNFVISEYLLEH